MEKLELLDIIEFDCERDIYTKLFEVAKKVNEVVDYINADKTLELCHCSGKVQKEFCVVHTDECSLNVEPKEECECAVNAHGYVYDCKNCKSEPKENHKTTKIHQCEECYEPEWLKAELKEARKAGIQEAIDIIEKKRHTVYEDTYVFYFADEIKDDFTKLLDK